MTPTVKPRRQYNSRRRREQAAQTLEQLSGAAAQLDRLRQEEASRHQTEVQEASRATVETLVELHDALSRAARQAGRGCRGSSRA